MKNTPSERQQALATIAKNYLIEVEKILTELQWHDEAAKVHIKTMCEVLRAYVEPYAIDIGKI